MVLCPEAAQGWESEACSPSERIYLETVDAYRAATEYGHRMTQLDIDFARAVRDEGIKRAADHAGETWMDRAVEDFGRFVKERGEATCEQWRHDWLTRGESAPATHKAYGAVANTASKRGLVVNTKRYVQAVSQKTHAHPVPVWKPA